ncbi:hypothetical protein [Desulfofalx alkaliphila]|uniref:hypothetical protein n=1 Tax=Desulfofalx alkaliphila TaxID=105483 RepID=UPI000B12A98F|nr:hypothetical protein [Desulfofalx alkaliphila]
MYRNLKPTAVLVLLILAFSLLFPGTVMATETIQDEGGMFERAIASVVDAIVGVFQTLEKTAQFKTLDVLVFNEGLSPADKEMAPFSRLDWQKLNTWYWGMAAAAGSFSLIAVLISAYRLMWAGAINPQARRDAIESMWRWLWAVAFIAGAPAIFYVVFQINNGLVDALVNIASGVSSNVDDMEKLGLSGEKSIIQSIITGSVLGTAIAKLMFCGIELWFNVIYILRHFALMAIFVFTPLMAWMWALNKNVNAMPIWFGELFSNAFMQTAHALCLLLFLTFCTIEDGKSWAVLLVWMYAIIPLSEMLRNSVQGLFTRMSGFDESGTATKVFGAIGGVSSLVGMGNLMRATTPIRAQSSSRNTGSGTGGTGTGATGSSEPGGSQTPLNTQQPNSQASAPAGYTTSASGLIVPSGAAASQQNANPEAPQSNQPPLGMVRAANAARVAGTAAGVVTGLGAKAMFAAVPGGQNIANLVSRGASSVTGATAAAGAVGVQAAYQGMQNYRETGKANMGEVFKNVTGSMDAKKAVLNTASLSANEGLNPLIGHHNANIIAPNPVSQFNNQPPPSMDGHRWR